MKRFVLPFIAVVWILLCTAIVCKGASRLDVNTQIGGCVVNTALDENAYNVSRQTVSVDDGDGVQIVSFQIGTNGLIIQNFVVPSFAIYDGNNVVLTATYVSVNAPGPGSASVNRSETLPVAYVTKDGKPKYRLQLPETKAAVSVAPKASHSHHEPKPTYYCQRCGCYYTGHHSCVTTYYQHSYCYPKTYYYHNYCYPKRYIRRTCRRW